MSQPNRQENIFIENIPDTEYHKPDGFISSSQCKTILKSPAHFQNDLYTEHTTTPDLNIGSAAHYLILQPEEYPNQVAHLPEGINRRTKAGKAEYIEFEQQAEGKIVLKADEVAQVAQMADAVNAHPLASKLLKNGKAEVSGYYQDETGANCKIRPDYLRQDQHVISDLKTSLDASPEGFPRQAANFKYHLSAAMYAHGYKAITGHDLEAFIFVVVEKSPPYNLAVYEMDQESMQAGYRLYRKAIDIFNECTRLNQWPGYSENLQTLTLPKYATMNPEV